ncbi:MAG TPA: ABC transporter permease [Stellaceae bacterium]|nr:ABC transporter permease [Stellaceae bacterium]
MTAESRPLDSTPGAGLARLAGSTLFVKLVAGAALLALWEIGVRTWAPAYVARPSGVVAVLPEVIESRAFLSAAGATLGSVIEGLAIALVLGIAVGIAMGRSFVVDRLIRYYVFALFAMPMVAILPLITLWFGYTDAARLATTVFAAFFSIVLNAADGARAVPLEYLEVGRSFRAKRSHVLVDIVLPASMPYLLAGIRLAAARALIGAVVAEFFISVNGLGFFILFNSRSFRHNQAIVAVLLLAGCGVGFEALVNGVTRHYFLWYRRDEKPR